MNTALDVLLLAGWLTAIYATIRHWRTPDDDTERRRMRAHLNRHYPTEQEAGQP